MDIKEIKYQYCQELDFEYEQFLSKLDVHPNTLDVKKFKWRLLEMFNESMKQGFVKIEELDDLKSDVQRLEEELEDSEKRISDLENEVEDLEQENIELENKVLSLERQL